MSTDARALQVGDSWICAFYTCMTEEDYVELNGGMLVTGILSSNERQLGEMAAVYGESMKLDPSRLDQPRPVDAVLNADETMNADPVNARGELVWSETDVDLPGHGIDVRLVRTYRSRTRFDGVLGVSWDHSYNRRIAVEALGKVAYFSDGEMHTIKFLRGTGSSTSVPYVSPDGAPVTLENRPGSLPRWILRDGSGVDQELDAEGYLSALAHPTGNRVNVFWEKHWPKHDEECLATGYYLREDDEGVQHKTWCSGLPSTRVVQRIVDTMGRELFFRYTHLGTERDLRLECVTRSATDGCATAITRYDYDSRNRLSGTRDRNSTGNTYVYGAWQTSAAHWGRGGYEATEGIADQCKAMCQQQPIDPIAQGSPGYCAAMSLGATDENGGVLDLCESDEFRAAIEDSPYCCVVTTDSYGTSWGRSATPSECMGACQAHLTYPNGRIYGPYEDLNDNIVEVHDGDGVLVAKNTYGEDPLKASFDRVLDQQVGPLDRGDRHAGWDYHDLRAEHAQWAKGYQPAESSYVVPLRSFVPMSLCDCVTTSQTGNCLSYAPPAYYQLQLDANGDPVAGSFDQQVPAFAVVVRDLRGPIRTQYFSKAWDLVREINHHAGDGEAPETTEFNVKGGRLIGRRDPSGVRTCRAGNNWDEPLKETRIAVGSEAPYTVTFGYDGRGLILVRTEDASGPSPRTKTWYRDQYGRPTLVTRQIDASGASEQTWFSYGTKTGPANVEPVTITTPERTTGYDYCSSPFQPAGPCQPRPLTTTVNPGGVAEITYSAYDDMGRLVLDGRPDNYVSNQFDATGRLTNRAHVVSGFATEWTAYESYGGLSSPKRIRGPRRIVELGYDAHGEVALRREIAADGSATTRTTCIDRDLVDGRVLAEIDPEGALTRRRYDDAGRLIAVDRGYASLSELGESWAQPCATNYYDNRDPDSQAHLGQMEAAARYTYKPGGLQVTAVEWGIGRTTTRWDGFARPIETVDGESNVQRVAFDRLGRRSWEALLGPGAGAYARPTVSSNGSVSDPALVSVTELGWDLLDRQTQVSRWHFRYGSAVGSAIASPDTFVYNCPNRAAGATTPPSCQRTSTVKGVTTIETYDGAGRLVRSTSPGGELDTSKQWSDPAHVTISERAPVAGGTIVTRVAYNSLRLPQTITDGAGAVLSQRTYDIEGHVVDEKTPGGAQHTWTWDAFGRNTWETQLIDGQGRFSRMQKTWDRVDFLVAQDDNRLNRIDRIHDPQGRLILEIDANRKTTRHEYVPSTQLRSVTVDANGTRAEMTYDTRGLLALERITDGAGLATPGRWTQRSYSYDAAGQRLWAFLGSSTGEWSYVGMQYDSLGNRVQEYGSLLNSLYLGHRYDGNERRVHTDVSGAASIDQTWDAVGRLAKVQLDGTQVAELSYSGRGGPTALYQGVKTLSVPRAETTYSYNTRGALSQIDVSAVSGVSRAPLLTQRFVRGVDQVPRYRSVLFAGGAGLHSDFFQADRLGRIIGENTDLAVEASLAEGIGNADVAGAFACGQSKPAELACVTSPALPQTARRTYLLEDGSTWDKREDAAGVVSYPRSSAHEIKSVDGPLALGPSNGGFEQGLTGWSVTGTSAIVSDAHGGASGLRLGAPTPTLESTATRTISVPATGARLGVWYKMSCPDTIYYAWAEMHVTSASTGAVGVLLPKVCATTGWTRVELDLAAFAGQTVTLTLTNHDDGYYADPVYTIFDDVELVGTQSTAVTWDAAGNVTAAGAERFTWNGLGQLVEARVPAGTVRYTYDALGRRTAEAIDGSSTRWVLWDGLEVRGTATVPAGRAPVIGDFTVRIGGQGIDDHFALYEVSTQALRHVHQGPDGSVIAVSQRGGLVEGYLYSVFGEVKVLAPSGASLGTTSSIGNRLTYHGHLLDPELGGTWMRSRAYRPAWGQFLSRDPIGIAGGFDLYAFVEANPLNFVDPLGFDKVAKTTDEEIMDEVTEDLSKNYIALEEAPGEQYPIIGMADDRNGDGLMFMGELGLDPMDPDSWILTLPDDDPMFAKVDPTDLKDFPLTEAEMKCPGSYEDKAQLQSVGSALTAAAFQDQKAAGAESLLRAGAALMGVSPWLESTPVIQEFMRQADIWMNVAMPTARWDIQATMMDVQRQWGECGNARPY